MPDGGSRTSAALVPRVGDRAIGTRTPSKSTSVGQRLLTLNVTTGTGDVNKRWHTLTGVRRTAEETKAVILKAARERFAADGYDRATIRAIAAEARIDPAMIMRYFGNKEGLFAAAAEFDLALPDLSRVPREEIGTALARHFVDRWEGDESLTLLLRAGVTNPAAAERMRGIFAAQLTPVVTAVPSAGPTAESRAGLAASQVLGMALCRYVLAFPPVVAMSRDEIIAWIGPTLQRYLVEPGNPDDME